MPCQVLNREAIVVTTEDAITSHSLYEAAVNKVKSDSDINVVCQIGSNGFAPKAPKTWSREKQKWRNAQLNKKASLP